VKSVGIFHHGLGSGFAIGAHFLEHIHEDPEGEGGAEDDEAEKEDTDAGPAGSLALAPLARGSHLRVEQLQELLWRGLIGFVLFFHGFHVGPMIGSREKAYLAPFFVFLAFLLAAELVSRVGDGYAHWMLDEPKYWIYPLQTVVCGWLLWSWREYYEFGPQAPHRST
jgi:hypothetical protein